MYIMKSKKKQKRRGGDSNLDSCTDTGFVCNHIEEGKTEYCGKYKPGSVCYSNKCYTPANCRNPTIPNTIDPNALKTNAEDTNALKTNAEDTNAEDTNALKTNAEDTNAIKTNAIDQDTKNQHTTPVKDGKFGSDNLINGAIGVAGLGAMYMGYKWLNKKKASSDDSSSPEKKKASSDDSSSPEKKKSSRRKKKSSRRKRKSSHLKSISHR